ncbi:MAG: hypothetical protein RL419_1355 [Actinomycetota bacterium]|jgi:AcrR family transcriptional regulator
MGEAARSTLEMILDVVIQEIDLRGENHVRMVAVAKAVGISEPALYHYFRNREDMITAAHVRRFRANLSITIDPFIAATRNCQSREEFAAVVRGVYKHSFGKDREWARALRAELVAGSTRRDTLRTKLAEEIDLSLADTITELEYAKSRGWLSSELDPRAFALFNLSLISSLVYAELYGDELVLEHWKKIALTAVTSLVLAETIL